MMDSTRIFTKGQFCVELPYSFPVLWLVSEGDVGAWLRGSGAGAGPRVALHDASNEDAGYNGDGQQKTWHDMTF
jgi:hypothetical protein